MVTFFVCVYTLAGEVVSDSNAFIPLKETQASLGEQQKAHCFVFNIKWLKVSITVKIVVSTSVSALPY